MKMLILHDAMKIFENGVFVTKKKDLKEQVFFQKKEFSQPWLSVNPFLQFSLDRTIWNKSRHYQFDWVRAAHLEYRSLVMKKLRITDIRIRKNYCWLKTSFDELNPYIMF